MLSIHFMRPYWLLAFVPALFYLAWVIYSAKQYNPWRNICDPHLLPALLQVGKTSSRLFFHLSLFLFLIISIFALAGPAWHKTKLPAYQELSSLMLVLDLSPAMQSSDLKPDRLTRAKFKIRDLINRSDETQMGLVVFSGEAFVASPLSQDANTLKTLLDELNPQMMPIAGSDIGQGLTEALRLFTQTGIHHGNVLLLTASEPTASSWAAAKALYQAGHQVQVLAMLEQNATTQKTIDSLQQLATMGGGAITLFTADESDIKRILNNHRATESIKDQNVENATLWQDAGPWFCLLLIPLVLLVLREKAL